MPTPAITQPEPLEPELALAAWLAHDDDAVDLVRSMIGLLRQIPGVRSADHQLTWEQAAWATLALRRGRHRGRRVTMDDLIALGLAPEVITLAWVVGGPRRKIEEPRRQAALAASRGVSIVWVAFWISRVEQACSFKKKSTWRTLGARAERETEVVIRELPAPAAGWLDDRLARARRPRRG